MVLRMLRARYVATLLVTLLSCLPALAQEDLLIADFDGPDYAGWAATGEAFGPGPAKGTLPGQMDVSGFQGQGLVNSFYNGDGTTGTLTSPPFKIERPRLCFLIGGGMHPGETCMDLLIDGKAVRTATGPNDKPGGTERLTWQSWDVTEFAGREAVLRIVDNHTGGWGHINIDQIVQCVEPPVKEGLLRFTAEKRYLNLPVKNGAVMKRGQLLVGGLVVRDFDIELADADPDFYVVIDLAPFNGQELVLHIDALDKGSKALELVAQDDVIRGSENLYREALRPQFHFSSQRGWNNDPNGLVYYAGEYHLYYQHNPYGWKWGNMHWGHAVSPDLVHWTELPQALYPQQYGDWVFSGSAIIDEANTAGFQTGAEKVIVAAYTSTGRGECIVYSNDRGRTFTEYEGNPVVKHQGRDPKLIWHEQAGHWAMAVYDEQPGKERGIAFYSSQNLKDWTFESRIEGYFECPEIFPLAVDGDPAQTKWVVYAASGEYSIGEFDGKVFHHESGPHPFNRGNCFYASQTFNNIPAEDGRRIQIAWGTVEAPGMPFNQMMDFPTELTLHTTGDGIRMFAQPAREIETLVDATHNYGEQILCPGKDFFTDPEGDLFRIRGCFANQDARKVALEVRGMPVTYDFGKQEISCGDKKAEAPMRDGVLELEVLVDRLSLEIFVNGGAVYMPVGFHPPTEARSLAVRSVGGTATARKFVVDSLKSAWGNP